MTRIGSGLAGYVVAALIPAVVIALTAPVTGEPGLSIALVTFLFVFPLSLAVVAIVGFPAFLVLRRFAPGRWWWVLPVGFLLGLLVVVVVFWPAMPRPQSVVYFGTIGAGSALAFWLIWRRGHDAVDPETGVAATSGD